jgi:hypothetical protein
MSEVTLVNIDGSAPEVEEAVPEAVPEEAQVPVETPVPKKTRGRPPGAPNKPKAVPMPAPTPEPESESEAEPEPEPPKKRKRVPVAPPPPPRRPAVAPDSPKTVYNKILVQRNQARVDRHAAKIQGYSSLLDQMLSY